MAELKCTQNQPRRRTRAHRERPERTGTSSTDPTSPETTISAEDTPESVEIIFLPENSQTSAFRIFCMEYLAP